MDIPAELRELRTNLRWTWRPNVIALFRDTDPDVWRDVNPNPVAFLARVPAATLTQRASELALEAPISHAIGQRWYVSRCRSSCHSLLHVRRCSGARETNRR